MKILHFCLLHICFLYAAACNNEQTSTGESLIKTDTSLPAAKALQPDSFPVKTLIPNVVCSSDATQSYAVYIPSNKPNAVIYFFDPHAAGALPLEKYKALADAYNFALTGSNNSKNGNDPGTTEKIWQALFTDTKNRIAFNTERMYVCGFSGGAKAAGLLALHHPEIKAVIAGGAGLPDGTTASNFNFSFTAIAGKGDMNMTDLVSLNNELDKTQTQHRIILFDGKHEWAPGAVMDIAFAGLNFDAMRNKTFAKNDSLINTFIGNSRNKIGSALRKKDYLQASNECLLAMNMLEGLTDISFFQQKNNSIANNAAYKDQLLQQQKLLLTEQNRKAIFNDQFQSGDINYWNKTITALNAQAKGANPEAAMNQRLLAYLSLAFYSISNQLINQNQNDEANYFVTLYKMADPGNSEAWYFSAVLNARNKNERAANDDLLKAVANGFNDKKRLEQQPEFQMVQPPINFGAIEAKMQ